MTRSEEDLQPRADTTGYAAPGSEHHGLRWDGKEFDDPRSGSAPAVLPIRDTSRGHDESLTFGGYSNEDAGGIFGPAPDGSAGDTPSYTPDYLTGTSVSSGSGTTPASGSSLPVRDSAASLGGAPQLPRREPAPHSTFASPFAAEFERAAAGTAEQKSEPIVDESAPTSSFAATPPASESAIPQQEDSSQDAEDTIRRIAESLGIDTDLTGRSRSERADTDSQPSVGNHNGVIGSTEPYTAGEHYDAAPAERPVESATNSAAPAPDPLKLPLRTPTPAYGLARTDAGAPDPGQAPTDETRAPARRLPAAAAAAAQKRGGETNAGPDGASAEPGRDGGSALPSRLPHRHSSEPAAADAVRGTDPEPSPLDPEPSSEDTASFAAIVDVPAATSGLPTRRPISGRNGTAVDQLSAPVTDPGDPSDTDVLRRRTSETTAAESDSTAAGFTLPRRGSTTEPAENTPAGEYFPAAQPYSSTDPADPLSTDAETLAPAHHTATESPAETITSSSTAEPTTPRRNRRAAPDHTAGESTEDIASRTGIAPSSRRAARRRAETGDAPALDVSVIMQLLLASHNLENVARNAEAGDVSLEDFITAAHRTRAAAVELVTTWFGGAEQMREFAQALLAATES
ncbi:hypothetical protein AB0L57_31320 [Nocardia sp. NPDC052254]|uniref:hypothetical protein n=1 Tax=Nocardia sp. NPDC052254 TaxID=3155681 RepID=UPI0034186EDF